MADSGGNVFDHFRPRMIIAPVLIGMGVLVWAFVKKFDPQAIESINWTLTSVYWLLMILVMMALRQFFYTWRIRYLTDNKLSWEASLESIFLWEFSSAATPSAVGGTAVALFILTKEGIPAGKTAAIVLCTIFLDMMLLMLFLIVALIWFDFGSLIPASDLEAFNISFFVFTFTLLLGYTLLVAYGLFINPKGLKWLLIKVTNFGFLKRWQNSAESTGQQLIDASVSLKSKSVKFWLTAFWMTAMTWTARFLVANCIIMAIYPEFAQHVLLYARQLVLMIMLMMSPTPGGSGVAELSFPSFISDLVGNGLTPPITGLWRMLTYYPYLFIGLAILPRWVSRVYGEKAKSTGP